MVIGVLDTLVRVAEIISYSLLIYGVPPLYLSYPLPNPTSPLQTDSHLEVAHEHADL